MTDAEAKASIIAHARNIDGIVAALERVEKDMKELGTIYEGLVSMYTDTADQIERLAAQIERKDIAEKVLAVTGTMKRRKSTEETKN